VVVEDVAPVDAALVEGAAVALALGGDDVVLEVAKTDADAEHKLGGDEVVLEVARAVVEEADAEHKLGEDDVVLVAVAVANEGADAKHKRGDEVVLEEADAEHRQDEVVLGVAKAVVETGAEHRLGEDDVVLVSATVATALNEGVVEHEDATDELVEGGLAPAGHHRVDNGGGRAPAGHARKRLLQEDIHGGGSTARRG
jgi:hypothetical protein